MGLLNTLSNVTSGSPRQMAIDNALRPKDTAAAIGAVALAIIYLADRS